MGNTVIATNIAALNAQRSLKNVSHKGEVASEKLSSGLRINKAADDAAGLAISEKMRNQIRGLETASRNSRDGVSLIQTADGALSEVHEMIARMRELAIQSATDTYTDADRSSIALEVEQLVEEINNIAENTQFNKKRLLNGHQSLTMLDVSGNRVAADPSLTVGIDTVLGAGTYFDAGINNPTYTNETFNYPYNPEYLKPTDSNSDTLTFTKTCNVGEYKAMYRNNGVLYESTFTESTLGAGLTLKGPAGTPDLTINVPDPSKIIDELKTVGGSDYITVPLNTHSFVKAEMDLKTSANTAYTTADTTDTAIHPVSLGITSMQNISGSFDQGEVSNLKITRTAGGYSLTATVLVDGGQSKTVNGTISSVPAAAVLTDGSGNSFQVNINADTLNRYLPGVGDQYEMRFSTDLGTPPIFNALDGKSATRSDSSSSNTGASPLSSLSISCDNKVLIGTDGEAEITFERIGGSRYVSITVEGKKYSGTLGTTSPIQLTTSSHPSGGAISVSLNKTDLDTVNSYLLAAGDSYKTTLLRQAHEMPTVDLRAPIYGTERTGSGEGNEQFTAFEDLGLEPLMKSNGGFNMLTSQEALNITFDYQRDGTYVGKATLGCLSTEIVITPQQLKNREDIVFDFGDGNQIFFEVQNDEYFNFTNAIISNGVYLPGPGVFDWSSASVQRNGRPIHLQVGANIDNSMFIEIESIRAEYLGGDPSLEKADLSTRDKALASIPIFDEAVAQISSVRAKLGAQQNRLEHTIKNLDTSFLNLSAAESRIRDTDMAQEMMNFTKSNVLQQAATSMLAQANQSPQSILQLLNA